MTDQMLPAPPPLGSQRRSCWQDHLLHHGKMHNGPVGVLSSSAWGGEELSWEKKGTFAEFCAQWNGMRRTTATISWKSKQNNQNIPSLKTRSIGDQSQMWVSSVKGRRGGGGSGKVDCSLIIMHLPCRSLQLHVKVSLKSAAVLGSTFGKSSECHKTLLAVKSGQSQAGLWTACLHFVGV